jgi:hypothetical protein
MDCPKWKVYWFLFINNKLHLFLAHSLQTYYKMNVESFLERLACIAKESKPRGNAI